MRTRAWRIGTLKRVRRPLATYSTRSRAPRPAAAPLMSTTMSRKPPCTTERSTRIAAGAVEETTGLMVPSVPGPMAGPVLPGFPTLADPGAVVEGVVVEGVVVADPPAAG